MGCLAARSKRNAGTPVSRMPCPPAATAEPVRTADRPLERATRQLMESRLGHDFSRVRVHVDDDASAAAEALGAAAFTVGNDVAFARGFYSTSTLRGLRLIAHELTHVSQQDRNEDGPPVSAATEAAAQTASAGLLSGFAAAAHAPTATAIAMQPRSLTRSLYLPTFSDEELSGEIREIRTWISAHPAEPGNEALANALDDVVGELIRRHPEHATSASDPRMPVLGLGMLSAPLAAGIPAPPPPSVVFQGLPAAAPTPAEPVEAAGPAESPIIEEEGSLLGEAAIETVGETAIDSVAAAAVIAPAAAVAVLFSSSEISREWPHDEARKRDEIEAGRHQRPAPEKMPHPMPIPHEDGEPDDQRRNCRGQFRTFTPPDCDGLDLAQVVEQARSSLTRFGGPGYTARVRRFGWIRNADECNGGPADMYHVDIFDAKQSRGKPFAPDVLSIFECTCCDEAGYTGKLYKPHISGGK